MSNSAKYYPLHSELVSAMRSADTFTGEFRTAVPPKVLMDMQEKGLVDQDCLTARGMAVRSWLFRGAPHAPDEVAKLLNSSHLAES